MNDLVEVAVFMYPNEADVLETLLQKENVEYFLDGNSNLIPGVETRLMIKPEDISRTVEIIKQGGFEKYLTTEI